MRILLIGDIVGNPGRDAIKKILPEFRKRRCIDFVVANAENIAGGSGMTVDTVDEMFDNQVDVLTSGDHVWKKKEIYERMDKDARILRPANYPKFCPGKGSGIFKLNSGKSVGIINVLGRVFMGCVDSCPFKTAEGLAKEMSKDVNMILVDMHAEATSEKVAIGRFLDGLVSGVFGTHTHVQTADEKIFPQGTGYITDIGMTGAQDSVIGRRPEAIIEHFVTCMPARFEIADADIELQGALMEIDDDTGKAVGIERVREKITDYS